MSFDPNPLGPQMHLRQLEREARQQQHFGRISDDNNARNADETANRKPWYAQLAHLLAHLVVSLRFVGLNPHIE